jgi:hypothetical protein
MSRSGAPSVLMLTVAFMAERTYAVSNVGETAAEADPE